MQPGGEQGLIYRVGLGVEVGNRHSGVEHLSDVGDVVQDGRGEVGDRCAEGASQGQVLSSNSFDHMAGCGENCLREVRLPSNGYSTSNLKGFF